jgi:hypothetical protein
MDDATRMALARAEVEKGVGFLKAAIQLLGPIERPSVMLTKRGLTDAMLDVEAAASRIN